MLRIWKKWRTNASPPPARLLSRVVRHSERGGIAGAALDGVVGALIALPDGLMVASQIPADLNGDTLAAFLPQIFGKVSQCTKELRMGELNNLNFTVGQHSVEDFPRERDFLRRLRTGRRSVAHGTTGGAGRRTGPKKTN